MESKFSQWAYVELMGHSKIAGLVSEVKFGDKSMIRVDVPESGGIPKFTKFFNVNAVYAITPLTKEDATDFALKILAKPIDIFDMQTIFQNKIREMVKKGELTEAHTVDNGDDDDDEF